MLSISILSSSSLVIPCLKASSVITLRIIFWLAVCTRRFLIIMGMPNIHLVMNTQIKNTARKMNNQTRKSLATDNNNQDI